MKIAQAWIQKVQLLKTLVNTLVLKRLSFENMAPLCLFLYNKNNLTQKRSRVYHNCISAVKREERIKEIVGQIRKNASKEKKSNPTKFKVFSVFKSLIIVFIVIKITRLGAKAML